MKTKKQFTNRILSLVLALVMVLGMLPMTTLTAYATPTEASELPVSYNGWQPTYTTYVEGLTQYFKYDGYLYQAVWKNCKASSVSLFRNDNTLAYYRNNTKWSIYLCKGSTGNTTKVTVYDLPKTINEVLFAYGSSSTDVNNTSNHILEFTCLAVKEHSHTFSYKSEANRITEVCTSNGDCGHSATASINASSASYTGSAITTASVTYSDDWAGSKDAVVHYENNTNVGTATAKTTIEGQVISITFQITAADISGATITLSPTSGTYNGTAYTPTVSVTYNGTPLVKDTDYTLSWNKTGFINADNYIATITGKGNFTGTKTAKFTITSADIKGAVVTLDQNTFVYDGQPHKPTAIVTFNGATLTEGEDYDLYYMSKDQIIKWENDEPVKFYGNTSSDSINAGQYYAIVRGKGNFAENSRVAYAAYTIEKATVTEPTIASKPYSGSAQTADVPTSDLYTVIKNDGGIDAGTYDVVLKLTDSANYKWATTDDAEITLQFKITQARNAWVTEPSISGWTYGEAANAPTAEAKFGTVYVLYDGTANDGTTYDSDVPPTKAGSYVARFFVDEAANYEAIGDGVPFTIVKATYDMTGAKWKYTEPFQYDGKEHKVEVIGLPAGVTVESYENNTATAVGDYYAKANLAYDGDNYNSPTINVLGWTIYNDWTPAEYTVNGSGWMNEDFVIAAKAGYRVSLTNTADGDWNERLTCSAETADGSVTFYLKDEVSGAISLAKTVSYKTDKTEPTGKVEFVERAGWQEFLNAITFDLFYKDEVTVKVTASDTLSGVAKIEYASSNEAKTLREVMEIADWMEYNGSFGVTLSEAKKFVYFVRITDNAGNVTYLSTDGAEYDTTAPVIDGVENGKTYYTTQKVTVTDKNPDAVTLNGNSVTGIVTLDGNKEVTYTITATDKAGNSTTVTVTMKPIKELAKATENLSNHNVTSADAPALKDLVEKLDELIADPDTSDDGEKETLEQHKTIAESLLQTIEDAAKATDTENTVKVDNVTPENVTPENKTDLENAKADLEKALEDNGGNYTEEEKKAIEDEIKRIDEALEVIGNVEAVEEGISKLPAVDTVKPDDEETIKAITDAQTAYNTLSDYEKSLVDEATKANLDKLVASLTAYDIVKGDGSSWTEDSDHSITFVVNGLFSKFVGIRVDGVEVDKANYEAKSGSTIITLKASYLDTLAVGEHTITVVYNDGSADGTFKIAAKSNTPATGDNSILWLWFVLLIASGTGVFGVVLNERKRKAVK